MKYFTSLNAFCFFLFMSIVVPGLAVALEESPALKVAQSFTALMDEGAYQSAYWLGSKDLRLSHKEQDWIDLSLMRRQRLGPVLGRTLKNIRMTSAYPDLPDGDYALVSFETLTRRKQKATEIVLVNTGGDVPLVSYYALK